MQTTIPYLRPSRLRSVSRRMITTVTYAWAHDYDHVPLSSCEAVSCCIREECILVIINPCLFTFSHDCARICPQLEGGLNQIRSTCAERDGTCIISELALRLGIREREICNTLTFAPALLARNDSLRQTMPNLQLSKCLARKVRYRSESTQAPPQLRSTTRIHLTVSSERAAYGAM